MRVCLSVLLLSVLVAAPAAGRSLRLRALLKPIDAAPGAAYDADGEARVVLRGNRLRIDLVFRGMPESALVEIRGCAADTPSVEVPHALVERDVDEARIVGGKVEVETPLAALLRAGEACFDVRGATTAPYLRGRLRPWPAPLQQGKAEPASEPRPKDG